MKLMMTTIAALAALALLPNCGSLEAEGCTMVGCGSAFDVSFAGATQEAGDYEITVTADDVKTTCTVTLPMSSCSDPVSCDQADPGFFVGTSGCALAAEEHRLTGVMFPTAAPAKIDVEVLRGGTSVGSGSYQPTYS